MSNYKNMLIVGSLIVLSFLVFYIGEQISFANKAPLETLLSQLIFVGFLWSVFGIIFAWKKYQLKKSEAALLNQISATEDVISNEDKQIKDKFVQALKQLHSNKKFLTGGSLYQKPWYILIGAPGSGKTTTLVNSMLNFADSHELSRQAIQGVGGTRLCDWWFTQEATLIDTAGRFTSQESDATRDKAAWQSFVQGLKKNRPLQAINGVIVFFSVTDLLSEDARLKNINNIKLRLKELSQSLSIKVPVYIIINKMDLLLGFNEYFSTLNQEARNQVFGVTLPYGQTVNENINILNNELKNIYLNLDNKKIDLLEAEVNLLNKSKILLFPERYKLLLSSINNLFAELSLEESVVLSADIRGFYFTSATQIGSPIDNILHNAGVLLPTLSSGQITPPSGKAFFVNDLLKKVIFLEAGLVAKNNFIDAKKIWYSTYCIIPVSFFVLVSIWSFNYIKTKSYIHQIKLDYEQILLLKQKTNNNDVISLSDYLQELNLYEEKLNKYYDKLLLNGLGINTIKGYTQQVNYAYVQSLKVALAQLLYKEIEAKLSQEKDNYLLLKSYLLLADEEKRKTNTEYLARIIVDETISKKIILGESQRLNLIKNIDQLLQQRPIILPIQLNQALIKESRDSIKNNGLVDVIYGELQQRLGKDISDWSLLKEIDNKNAFVISGKQKMDILIPAFFTKQAFKKIKDNELEQTIETFGKDSAWVLGEDVSHYKINEKELRQLAMEKYLTKYYEKWSTLLADLSIVRSHTVSDNLNILKLLSTDKGGTLRKLLDSIINQTILTQDITDNKITDIMGKISSKMMEDTILRQAKALVDDRFIGLANFIYSPEDKKNLEAFTTLVKEIESQLYLLEETSKKGQPLPDITPLQVKIMTISNTMPAPISNILKGLYVGIGQLSKGAAAKEMNTKVADISSSVCKQNIKNLYPFSRASNKDMSFSDFGKLFSSQGVLREFFEKNLKEHINKEGEVWRPINTSEGVSISQNVVTNFQRVEKIRQGFFQNNMPLPFFSFTIRWLEVAPEFLMQQASIAIDGQQSIIQPNHTQVINWPALPGANYVSINVNNMDLSGYKFEGPWAILRFIDKGKPIYENGGQRIKLKWNTDIGVLSAEILSVSPNHPFILNELEKFSCQME